MLAVTVLERAGVHELRPSPTLAMLRSASDKLATEEAQQQQQLQAFVLELIDACC
jgi:hypothetical protein